MAKKIKGTKIKLEFTIPDESPQKEIISKKFTELWDAIHECSQGGKNGTDNID